MDLLSCKLEAAPVDTWLLVLAVRALVGRASRGRVARCPTLLRCAVPCCVTACCGTAERGVRGIRESDALALRPSRLQACGSGCVDAGVEAPEDPHRGGGRGMDRALPLPGVCRRLERRV